METFKAILKQIRIAFCKECPNKKCRGKIIKHKVWLFDKSDYKEVTRKICDTCNEYL